MNSIELTQGQFALVDSEDLDWLSQWRWHARWDPHTKSFYAVRWEYPNKGKKKQILMHRAIMKAGKGEECDHAGHDTLDNRKENLRFCTSGENKYNSSIQTGCTSKYKGVDLHRRLNRRPRWRAQIQQERQRHFLGYFDTEEEAGLAYDAAASRLFGEFALLNFGKLSTKKEREMNSDNLNPPKRLSDEEVMNRLDEIERAGKKAGMTLREAGVRIVKSAKQTLTIQE